jgi:hypothetical protein
MSPDYQLWFGVFAAALMALVGAYARGVGQRVDEVREDIKDLRSLLTAIQVLVAKDYQTRGEFKDELNLMHAKMDAYHRRLDALRVPYSPEGS